VLYESVDFLGVNNYGFLYYEFVPLISYEFFFIGDIRVFFIDLNCNLFYRFF